MKKITNVGELRELLKYSEDCDSVYFKLDEVEYIECTGATSSAGGRITILWFDRKNVDANYQI